MKMKILILSVVLFGIPNISFSSDYNALKKLKRYAVDLSRHGYTCRNSASGKYLRQGQSYTVYTTLYRENTYRLIAAGNIHARDIDITLHDENHNIISKDKSVDSIPQVYASPRWDGRFHAIVKMYKGKGYSNLMTCWKKNRKNTFKVL